MFRASSQICAVVFLVITGTVVSSGQDILITELMAVRSAAFRDDDGDASDFIELYNAGSTAEDLGGYFLSDDCALPFKWTFPAGVVIAPGEFRVVWASEKDRHDLCCDLHTNFRLVETGECLVLSDPTGEQVHLYGPYAPQELGNSYGLAMAGGLDRQVRHHFSRPTPGAENVAGAPELTPPPVFSDPSGAYPPGLVVDLSMEVPVAGTEIRYTLNESVPAQGSTLYTAPVAISGDVVVAARAFQPGLLPSKPIFRHYITLADNVLDFSSTIPIAVCTTLGRKIPGTTSCGNGPYTPGRFLVFKPGEGEGRARLTDDAYFAHRVGYRRRGNPNYSCGRIKFYFNMEFRDRENKDDDEEIFDFANHSDFAMWGPYEVDGTFLRNPIAFWMSREVGQWAPRTQFLETFLHSPLQGGQGALTMSSYWGVYVLMERNKRGGGRIDVNRLDVKDNEEPDVTGGYILQRDRIKFDDVGTSAGGHNNIVIEYPKRPTDSQRDYITDYLRDAIKSLDPFIGSQEDAELVDFRSMMDHHILNWFMKNVDAFRLSTYMYKPRGGKLFFGPMWDIDRSMGSTDPRSVTPEGFHNDNVWDAGTRYFEDPGPPGDGGFIGSWYGRLFDNEEPVGNSPWARAYRSRWRELRQGPLNTAHIFAQIDAWARVLREPAARNFARWPDTFPRSGGHSGAVDHLKNWLNDRAAWIDGAFLPMPQLTPSGGPTEPGTRIEISVEDKTAQVFYTLNGPDPLQDDRSPAPEATEYEEPFVVNENTRVRVRSRISGVWSGMVEEFFFTHPVSLVVSEVMFNPISRPEDSRSHSVYEFLEFHNPGDQPTNLEGVVLDRPHFEFSQGDITTLGPGGYLVVARNVDAFVERYGSAGIAIAGQFFGSLKDSRQAIKVKGPAGEILMDFEYEGEWHPAANGQGHSLVFRNPTVPPEWWNRRTSWRASLDLDGSPGREDSRLDDRRLQGDLDGNGLLDITDVIRLLINIFGQPEDPCNTAEGNLTLQDTDGDGALTENDALRLLRYCFLGEEPPVKGLECTSFSGCAPACN